MSLYKGSDYGLVKYDETSIRSNSKTWCQFDLFDPQNVDENHESIRDKTPPPEEIRPPEGFRSDTVRDFRAFSRFLVSAPIFQVTPSIGSNSVIKIPEERTNQIENKSQNEAPNKEEQSKIPTELSSEVFGLAKEVQPAQKVEKSEAVVQNDKPHSDESSEESDDEEDVRQLEGRTVSAKGQEVHTSKLIFHSLFNNFCFCFRSIVPALLTLEGRKKKSRLIRKRKMILGTQ